MPRLIIETGDILLIEWVANHKSVFVCVLGQPLSTNGIPKTLLQTMLARSGRHINGQPGLVLRIAGAGGHFIGNSGSVAGQIVVIQLMLVLIDRKSTRLNSSHVANSYAVFCLKIKSKALFVRDIH